MRRKSLSDQERRDYRAAWRRKDRQRNPEKYASTKRRSYLKHKHVVLDRVREYQVENRDQIVKRKNAKYASQDPEVRRDKTLRSLYGIGQAQYSQMYAERSGRCDICGTHKEILCVDHCHASSHVRGLLCHACNQGIGLLKDDPEILKMAALYVCQPPAILVDDDPQLELLPNAGNGRGK